MKIITYLSYVAIPFMILCILSFAVQKKQEAYSLFLVGAKEGMSVILKIFPTMIGIFVAIQLFQVSGGMDLLIKMISPFTNLLAIPSEVIPLGVMRSISGGASLGLLSQMLEQYGPDSLMGNIASTILGATETTLYVIAIYTSSIGVKQTRGVLGIALCCDCIAFLVSIFIWKIIF